MHLFQPNYTVEFFRLVGEMMDAPTKKERNQKWEQIRKLNSSCQQHTGLGIYEPLTDEGAWKG